MKQLKKGLLILLLPLLAFTTIHKYYVSVTNVSYSEKDESLQITTRIFVDDLDIILEERYGVTAKLATDKESKQADEYLEKYLRKKFKIQVDDEQKVYELIGRKYENDVCVFYLEVPKINLATVKCIEIENLVLTDLYDEQQNIVHFRINGDKKSFVLLKSDTKGMLKL